MDKGAIRRGTSWSRRTGWKRRALPITFFYLAGIAGAGRGEAAALASASVFNQTSPRILGSSMLTIYPQSRLFRRCRPTGGRRPGRVEKLEELKTLVEHLERPLCFAALGASNAVSVHGFLPEERDAVAAAGAGLPPGARGRPAPLPGRSAASVVEIILEKHIGIV